MKSKRKMILDLPFEALEHILKVAIENLPDDMELDDVHHDIESDRVRFRLHSDSFKSVPENMMYPVMNIEVDTEYNVDSKEVEITKLRAIYVPDDETDWDANP